MKSSHQLMFLLLFVGYMTLVYVRQSVSFAAPVIAEKENLKNSDLGLIISSQQLGYTLIKFIGGALADTLDPCLTFTACLLMTGLTCAGFTAVTSVTYFALLWFLCGMAQGPAWSACAVILKQNFPSDQFATWWSVLSTSANVAGTAGPFMSQFIVSHSSWRASLLSAAFSSLVLGILCSLLLKTSKSPLDGETQTTRKNVKDLNFRALWNPVLMLLCMNYLLVSVIRGACNDWGQMYIISNKGQSLLAGSSFISSQEIGGIVGSLLTGYLSDFMVSKGSTSAKPRLSLTIFLTVIQTIALYFIVFKTDSQSTQLWTNSLGFVIGFGMYSAIALLGVASMETAPKNLSGTAHSLATLGGNLGRVLAGYPLSIIATWMSWHESFIVVFLTSFLSIGFSCLCLRFLHIKEQSAPLKKFD